MTTRKTLIARLADRLESQREPITAQWLDTVLKDARIEASNLLTHQQLLDCLPALFDELCRFLRNRDAVRLAGPVQEEARAHGHDRWKNGYAIDELLRELHLLRRIVLSGSVSAFADADPDFDRSAETTSRNLIEEFFSSVISDSVRQFVGEQQKHVADYAERLEGLNRQLEINNGQLKEIAASRIQLTRAVAHELRTVLHSFSSALPDPAQGVEPAGNRTQRNIGNMEVLVDQLLTTRA